jgi:hypothetical protein
MRHLLKTAGLAALVAFAGLTAAPASAQEFGIRIGPDRPRVIERRDYREYREPRVIERRVYRGGPRRVCRTEMRERVRPNGVVVRRPVEVCTTRGGY